MGGYARSECCRPAHTELLWSITGLVELAHKRVDVRDRTLLGADRLGVLKDHEVVAGLEARPDVDHTHGNTGDR